MLEDRLEALFKNKEEYSILEKMKGCTLVGRKYKPLFPYFRHLKSDQPNQGAFRIVRYVYVTMQKVRKGCFFLEIDPKCKDCHWPSMYYI